MTDEPIAFTADGRALFDNTPTVVAVVIKSVRGVIVVRRAHEPGTGKLGLPAGYHMRGETWQQAGARETLEETGYEIDPAYVYQDGQTVTDEYGNNLLIARLGGWIKNIDPPGGKDGEALETFWCNRIEESDWAFPLHLDAVRKALNGH